MIMVASKLIAIIILFINTATCDEVKSGGDVHITTVDGLTYDFNGHGEYVFFKANDFEIQARTDYVIPGNIQSTMFTAFAFYDKKYYEQIEVQLNRGTDDITVYRNGTEICNSSFGITKPCEMPPKHRCFVLAGNGIVFLQGCSTGNFHTRITFSSGKFMDISLEQGRHYLSNSSGLAGNASYGFILRNGTILPNDSAESDMFAFGESWALQKETESHFNYSISGESFSFYNGNHTVPIFLEKSLLGNLTLLFNGWSKDNITLFNETCRTSWDNKQNDRCLLTIARTGNLSLGQIIIKGIEDEHRRWLILNNRPPEFHLPDRIDVNNHETYTLNLKNFTKDEDLNSVIFHVTTDIPSNEFNLTDDGIFTWRVGPALRSLDTILIFYVFDSLNASTSQTVKLNYCGCEEIIQCDYDITSKNSSNNVKRTSCNCPKYHSGDYCEIINDPCNSAELTCSISCNSSVPQTTFSWPCTPCPNGTADRMRGDTQECFDIDECDISYNGNGKCEHLEMCNNTYGSFVCGCRDGYTLNTNKHSCDDINECLYKSLCQQNEVCRNVPGAYVCECAPNYQRIGQNNCTKIDIDECDISYNGSDKCEQTCHNTDGSFVCGCGDGYTLNANKHSCDTMVQTTINPSVNNKTRMCFACEETFSPAFCERVKSCEDNQLCFVEKISTPEGSIHFKSGCRAQEICEKHHFNTGDGCFECCNGSFCNSRGCGDKGYPARGSRGPICLECARVNAPEKCDQIKLCSSNQMCFIEELTWGDNSLFHLGCRNVHQCAADGFVKRSLPTCSTCCGEDFCNMKCQKHDTVIPLIG